MLPHAAPGTHSCRAAQPTLMLLPVFYVIPSHVDGHVDFSSRPRDAQGDGAGADRLHLRSPGPHWYVQMEVKPQAFLALCFQRPCPIFSKNPHYRCPGCILPLLFWDGGRRAQDEATTYAYRIKYLYPKRTPTAE
eukprot:scaffold114414_cov45-Tisochrysis_lutea.AAC.2